MDKQTLEKLISDITLTSEDIELFEKEAGVLKDAEIVTLISSISTALNNMGYAEEPNITVELKVKNIIELVRVIHFIGFAKGLMCGNLKAIKDLMELKEEICQ